MIADHGRTMAFAVLLLLASTLGVRAQSSPALPPLATPPVNVMLPNYNSVTTGEIASLEAGAFIVRANDTSSIFYNPAGVTLADRTSISGSAGVFQLSSVAARQATTSGSSFQQIPSMFAMVVNDLFGRSDWAGGLAVSRVNAWSQGFSAERTFTTGNTSDRLSYTSAGSMDGWLANIGVGYGASDRLRVGGSLDGQLTMMARDGTIGDQYRDGSTLSTALVATSGSSWTAALRLTAGAQYDVTSKIQIGAVVRTPGLNVMSSGSAVLEGVSRVSGTTSTASFFDAEGDVTYRIPFEARAGVAYKSGRGQIEFDLMMYSGSGLYEGFSSDRPTTVLTDAGIGIVAEQQLPAIPAMVDSRAVVNIAVGGHYNLTSDGKWLVHGGYGTDRSPVGEQDTLFTKIHLQKFTAGLSGRTKHVLGSLGIQYSTGSSNAVLLRQLQSGQHFTTNFDVSSLGLVYSLALLF
jgi:long-subunit fatty acid transport protein